MRVPKKWIFHTTASLAGLEYRESIPSGMLSSVENDTTANFRIPSGCNPILLICNACGANKKICVYRRAIRVIGVLKNRGIAGQARNDGALSLAHYQNARSHKIRFL
jgi:hypothetical protein